MTLVQIEPTEGVDRRYRIKVIIAAILASLAMIVATQTATAPQAQALWTKPSVTYAFTLNGYHYYKVCAPAKCVTTKNYHPLNVSGVYAPYYLWGSSYCSASVGCFTYQGVNYGYKGGPVPTYEQKLKTQQCAVNLGFTWAATLYGGPWGFILGGVALAIWGCV